MLAVEMAGIEPASKELGQRHATGLVDPLFLAGQTSIDRVRDLPSEFFFDWHYRRRARRTPTWSTPVPSLSGEAERQT